MNENHDVIIDTISDAFADFIPKICEALSKADDEEKDGYIGAATEMFLGMLINYCFYGDFMAPNTDKTEKWKAKIATQLAYGCIIKGGAEA